MTAAPRRRRRHLLTSPDLPAPDTGITRPNETAVSRGVEIMVATHRESGTFGLSARIQECYEERRPPTMTRVALR